MFHGQGHTLGRAEPAALEHAQAHVQHQHGRGIGLEFGASDLEVVRVYFYSARALSGEYGSLFRTGPHDRVHHGFCMVDVERIRSGSFYWTPTPATICPIEYTMELKDYEEMGGHIEVMRPFTAQEPFILTE